MFALQIYRLDLQHQQQVGDAPCAEEQQPSATPVQVSGGSSPEQVEEENHHQNGGDGSTLLLLLELEAGSAHSVVPLPAGIHSTSAGLLLTYSTVVMGQQQQRQTQQQQPQQNSSSNIRGGEMEDTTTTTSQVWTHTALGLPVGPLFFTVAASAEGWHSLNSSNRSSSSSGRSPTADGWYFLVNGSNMSII
jgi:hypothetical protein